MTEGTLGSGYIVKRRTSTSRYAYKDGCRPLGGLTRPFSIVLLLYAVISILLAVAFTYGYIDPRIIDETALDDVDLGSSPLAMVLIAIFGLYILERVLFVVGVFLTCRFTFRAMKNLHTIGNTTPTHSPKASVIWYFVPFANLAMPANAMSEIHHGSIEETGTLNVSSLVSYWWSAWLGFNIFSYVSNAVFGWEGAPLSIGFATTQIALLLGAASALLLRKLINRILTAQDQFTHANVSETFA